MAARETAEFPVLTAARLVCRERLAALGVDALRHVACHIDAFLAAFSGPEAMAVALQQEFMRHEKPAVRALEYLDAHSADWYCADAAEIAASCGLVHVLRWLGNGHGHRCKWTYRAMDAAAEEGQLEAVQWLHANRTEGCTTDAMDFAARGGHLHVVQWLHRNREEGCTADALTLAARHGHLEVVQWLYTNRSEEDLDDALRSAAWKGQVAVVQWLQSVGAGGCNGGGSQGVSGRGHQLVAQWLQSNAR